MSVDIAYAKTEQSFICDEMKHFLVMRDFSLRQLLQAIQDNLSLTQTSQRQFASNKWMGENAPLLEEIGQGCIAFAQRVDPDGCIDENHAGSVCRRRTGFRSGSLPPSRASRRALSRSINALSASRISADFS